MVRQGRHHAPEINGKRLCPAGFLSGFRRASVFLEITVREEQGFELFRSAFTDAGSDTDDAPHLFCHTDFFAAARHARRARPHDENQGHQRAREHLHPADARHAADATASVHLLRLQADLRRSARPRSGGGGCLRAELRRLFRRNLPGRHRGHSARDRGKPRRCSA